MEARHTAVGRIDVRIDGAAAVAVFLLAPLIALRDVWRSGVALVPGDPYDGRLVAFFLEHGGCG